MADSSSGYIAMANELLRQLHIPKKVSHLEDIGANVFVPLFQALCGESIPTNLIEQPQSDYDERHNLRLVLDTLSTRVLQVSLSHITAEDIVAGDRTAIANLLEIFQGLLEYMLKQLEYEEEENDGGEKGARESDQREDLRIGKEAERRREAWGDNGVEEKVYHFDYDPHHHHHEADIDQRGMKSTLIDTVTGRYGEDDGEEDHRRLEILVDRTMRLSQDALDRGDLVIDRGQRARRSGVKGLPPNTRIVTCRTDEEYAKLRLHIKRVEEEASRVGELAHEVAEQAVLKDKSRREREFFLRRKLADYLSSGSAPSVDGRTGTDWIEDYRAVCRRPRGEERPGQSQKEREGQARPVKERLREYVKDNEDQVQELRHEALTAAKRVALGNKRGGPREKRLDEAVEEDRRVMHDAMERQGRAIRSGPDWMREKAERIGTAYQHELETVATEEVDALTKSRERLTQKEEALRRLATTTAARPAPSARTPVLRSSKGKRGLVHVGGKTHSVAAQEEEEEERNRRELLGENPNDDQLLEFLLGEFPHLHLSQQTIREMWNKAANQARLLSRGERDLQRRKSKEQQVVEEAERRQRILSEILRKEVLHNQRLKDQRERQATRRALKARGREMRQQHVRAKKYYEEFSTQMRSKMMRKRTKEEQIFRHLFQEALKIQRERLADMRRYAKDVRSRQASEESNELTSLENYYRDRFAMLADSLRTERNEIQTQEKAQDQILIHMKRELRKKLETDISDIQDSLVRADDGSYFRQLDADRALYDLLKTEYRP